MENDSAPVDFFAPNVPVGAKHYTPQPSPIPPLNDADKAILRRIFFPGAPQILAVQLIDSMNTPSPL